MESFDANVIGGAGGTSQAPGDYFYGDARRPFTAVGLRGLQRALPAGTGVRPIPLVDGSRACAVTMPGAPTIGTATVGNASALVRWTKPANAGSGITGYAVKVVNSVTNAQIGRWREAAAAVTSLNVTGLVNGTSVSFQVQATSAVARGAFSAKSNVVRPSLTVASAPVILRANPGALGGTVTARANWLPPASDGGAAINGYVVTAMRINTRGAVISQTNSVTQHFSVRTLTMTLPAGNYQFVVRARNAMGLSAYSARSQLVTAQ